MCDNHSYSVGVGEETALEYGEPSALLKKVSASSIMFQYQGSGYPHNQGLDAFEGKRLVGRMH